MLAQKVNDFYKRWDVDLNEDEQWRVFKDRFMNSYAKILGAKVYGSANAQQEFYDINGVRNTSAFYSATAAKDFRTYCRVYESLWEANGKKFIQFLQALFWMDSITPKEKENLFTRLIEDIEISHVPLVLAKSEEEILFYPAGARLLDENLINPTLAWLEDYPRAYKAFRISLESLNDRTKAREVVDSLRLSLELFLREFFNNSKSLENQQATIGRFLKDENTNPEIANLYWNLVDGYSKYQNANAKHGSSVQLHEVEFLLYLTASFIRLLSTLK